MLERGLGWALGLDGGWPALPTRPHDLRQTVLTSGCLCCSKILLYLLPEEMMKTKTDEKAQLFNKLDQ